MMKCIFVFALIFCCFSVNAFQESMNRLSDSPREVINPNPGSSSSGSSGKSGNDKIQKERERVQKEVQRVLTLTGHDGKLKNVINKTQTNVNAVLKDAGRAKAVQSTQVKLDDLKKQVNSRKNTKSTIRNQARPKPRPRPL
ncbi:hypothetical protein [Rheinheimera texasensis]|uniref:hypothetical protein n=1 Tax=Rheinheimera texasensis TaxID=306205 RepID=UPI0012FEE008|nr:hypothetical protein [Rheinheimera texasensis]